MASSNFDIMIGQDGAFEMHCEGLRGAACLESAKIFEKMMAELKSSHNAFGFEGDGTRNTNCPKNIGSSKQSLL